MTGIRAQGVVVGVDETSGSRAALAFAMHEAARRGSAVEVITAWTWSRADGNGAGTALSEQARQLAQQIQDKAVAQTLTEVDARPVVSRQVVEGDAGNVLLKVAKDAAYLVVGASTRGQLRRSSLGSVSDYCVRNASCPVVVVPAPVLNTKPQPREGARDARG